MDKVNSDLYTARQCRVQSVERKALTLLLPNFAGRFVYPF